jgi:adenine-specific DNA-methyltransferase
MPTLEFKGKQFVYSHHLSVPFRELKVDAAKSLPAEGQKPSLDDNLIIHGDNLEALKALLPTHAGKIDCIFIDPPYNTGNEGWCYNDNVRSPLMKEWLKKSANPVDKEDLERHDKWLCMMWPRLNLLHELLSDDGIMFITIDDNEVHRLRLIMDEIFGEERFLANMIWQKRYAVSSDAKGIPEMHDHILCYYKFAEFRPNLLERSDKQDKAYSNPDNDPRGPWRSDNLLRSEYRERDCYPIKNPNTGEEFYPPPSASWRHPQGTIERMIEDGRIYFGKDGTGRPIPKRFLNEVKQGIVASGWLTFDEVGHTDEAKRQLKQVFSENIEVFATPKPVRLIQRILEIATDENSIILDSFAGSGTTAHAILEANRKDGGNRRFILIECEEYADTLTAERVRRVISGYPFAGNQREELFSTKINWTDFAKKQQKILREIEHIEETRGAAFDKVKKEIKDGVLTVTGERTITEHAPGLGGSFTYCTLGEPVEIESLLTGKGIPAFDALARYVFYTATGQSLETVAAPSADGFIGETELFRIHLFYQPDTTWLRSNESALNAERVAAISKGNRSGKRSIVFAVAKFMSQKELTKERIEFCQLPYAVHRILGD